MRYQLPTVICVAILLLTSLACSSDKSKRPEKDQKTLHFSEKVQNPQETSGSYVINFKDCPLTYLLEAYKTTHEGTGFLARQSLVEGNLSGKYEGDFFREVFDEILDSVSLKRVEHPWLMERLSLITRANYSDLSQKYWKNQFWNVAGGRMVYIEATDIEVGDLIDLANELDETEGKFAFPIYGRIFIVAEEVGTYSAMTGLQVMAMESCLVAADDCMFGNQAGTKYQKRSEEESEKTGRLPHDYYLKFSPDDFRLLAIGALNPDRPLRKYEPREEFVILENIEMYPESGGKLAKVFYGLGMPGIFQVGDRIGDAKIIDIDVGKVSITSQTDPKKTWTLSIN